MPTDIRTRNAKNINNYQRKKTMQTLLVPNASSEGSLRGVLNHMSKLEAVTALGSLTVFGLAIIAAEIASPLVMGIAALAGAALGVVKVIDSRAKAKESDQN